MDQMRGCGLETRKRFFVQLKDSIRLTHKVTCKVTSHKVFLSLSLSLSLSLRVCVSFSLLFFLTTPHATGWERREKTKSKRKSEKEKERK